jgi:hypothetical protein
MAVLRKELTSFLVNLDLPALLSGNVIGIAVTLKPFFNR